MTREPLTRRQFLVRSAVVAALAAVPTGAYAAGAPVAPASLAAVVRTLYPHEGLAVSFYADVAARLWAETEAVPSLRAQIDAGVRTLDDATPGDFAAQPEVVRRVALRAVEQAPWVKAVAWRAAELLYRDPLLWQRVGYEGPSLPKGGYLTRGFDDISWLPQDAGR